VPSGSVQEQDAAVDQEQDRYATAEQDFPVAGQEGGDVVQNFELPLAEKLASNTEVQAHRTEEESERVDGKVEEVPSGEVSSQTDSMDTNEIEMALKE
jgi:hypothetical protein